MPTEAMTKVNTINQSAILARSGHRPNNSAWRDELRRAFRRPGELFEYLGLADTSRPYLDTPDFPMLVPEAYARRMRSGDPDDPLLRQVLPDPRENDTVAGFVSDPVGDSASRRERGLLHKYAGRVLIITTGACAIHCRHWFRQEFPYTSDHDDIARDRRSIDYIRARDDIEEVILSGGDPLMLDTSRLIQFTDQLRTIPHIQRLRLHTRLPVVLPSRVDSELCQWIESLPWPVVIVIHANHAAEFDADVDRAMSQLRRAGATLFNQAVLLAGINDNEQDLSQLMRRSFSAGVVPYYLHLLDRISGAARFDTDRQMAVQLIDALRVQLSGYLVPRLVREQAGAPYKLPVL